MMIIGCDLHTRYQQIAMLDTETGELVELRLQGTDGTYPGFLVKTLPRHWIIGERPVYPRVVVPPSLIRCH
jgi:hypothetical protein